MGKSLFKRGMQVQIHGKLFRGTGTVRDISEDRVHVTTSTGRKINYNFYDVVTGVIAPKKATKKATPKKKSAPKKTAKKKAAKKSARRR